MLRSTAARSLRTPFTRLPTSRSSFSAASSAISNTSPRLQLSKRRPQVLVSMRRPTTTSIRFATNKNGPPYDKIDLEAEKKILEKPIQPKPDEVSVGSSTIPVFGEGKQEEGEMLDGIKADVETIKETFALTEVPKESLYIGAAGVLPYAATSLSTVYLAYDINHAASGTGKGILFSPELAHQLLEIVTPIQIGYGAVIISFLGAIHWGLEYAGYGGYHSYRRYMYGVIAPAVAWPTMFMPVEYALITQFAAFNFLYFADARATVKGWFPPWYSTYRFVLTFFVGASIVISLVGRGQISHKDTEGLKKPADYLKADRDSQWEALEREEMERIQSAAKSDDEEADDEESDDESGKKDDDKSKTDNKSDDESDDKQGAKKDDKATKKEDKKK